MVLYLATSPHLFPQICEQLGVVGLNSPNVRVVLEKPLGHDLGANFKPCVDVNEDIATVELIQHPIEQ